MRLFKRITLSSAPFYASLIVVTSLAVFIGIFWAINEYQAYQESIRNIRSSYEHQYKVRVKEELGKVVELIDYRRHQNELRVEIDIRERVQAAYTIASHKYRLYHDEMSMADLRSMIIELLRPIRWNNGRGYYFAGRATSGVIDLFADEPYFEGKSAEEFQEITGSDVIGEISAIVRDKEAGLYRYNLIKPQFPGRSFSKIAFVKYFPPLDWFIGAGIYNDDLEDSLQHEVLDRIRNIRFGKDGEVFCFRVDGTILSDQDQRLIGRSVRDLVDNQGVEYGEAFLRTAMTEDGGGYVNYMDRNSATGTFRQKLSYVETYRDWNWVLGTAMFMDAMEHTIAGEAEAYQRISFRNVFAFIVFFAVAVAFLLLSTYLYSLKIKQEISLFTNFFRKAADSNAKISKGSLMFREFEDLASFANRMVDERINSELLLHRDELRLDTLLQLGMMDKYSLQEKYDFVLQRIVQITRSEEGYLALVNDSQTHLTICSYMVSDEPDIVRRQEELAAPRTLDEGGLPGRAVRKRTPLISNSYPPEQCTTEFPYRIPLCRHLDVPIYNDGRIVIVAGVCNNSELYDTSDIRQVTMLVEGMWLHVLRKVSEKEMASLERQIIAVSENERSKIGRDLHDDLGSHLAGVELLSKVLQQQLHKEAPARERQLATIRDLIREAIEKTRRLSQGLYPVHVVEYGLEAAIEELAAEVKKVFGVNVDFSWEGAGDTLGKNTATHLHYIIREAVFNAARHGKSQNIGVYASIGEEGFVVKIVDDGKGFGAAPANKGMGFHTMKYRAKAIGAELTINSIVNGGTVIVVRGNGLE
ncbi:MAG: cache domain-containing protein [Desulforhopalus sp.]